jgi:glucose dehydrogenase
VLDGAASGREVLLTKDRTTFGKPGVLVVAIDRQGGVHVLSRVEGQALVSVNGAPMPPAGVPLHDGDLIDLTGTRLRFSCA